MPVGQPGGQAAGTSGTEGRQGSQPAGNMACRSLLQAGQLTGRRCEVPFVANMSHGRCLIFCCTFSQACITQGARLRSTLGQPERVTCSGATANRLKNRGHEPEQAQRVGRGRQVRSKRSVGAPRLGSVSALPNQWLQRFLQMLRAE